MPQRGGSGNALRRRPTARDRNDAKRRVTQRERPAGQHGCALSPRSASDSRILIMCCPRRGPRNAHTWCMRCVACPANRDGGSDPRGGRHYDAAGPLQRETDKARRKPIAVCAERRHRILGRLRYGDTHRRRTVSRCRVPATKLGPATRGKRFTSHGNRTQQPSPRRAGSRTGQRLPCPFIDSTQWTSPSRYPASPENRYQSHEGDKRPRRQGRDGRGGGRRHGDR